MAITYRARDTVLNSLVALKVIDRKVARNPGARSRFLREARAAANIRHPNVARVTYYGEQDGECFYAMELVEGETLEARVRRDGPMPLAVALDTIEQTARALAAAEACGVVHRDIKPSNVMLESDSSGALRVKLIDYGVAKVMGPQTQSGAEQTHAGFIGTPAFASPEQFAGAGQLPVDTRSDIYSLGVTLWYLLTGRTPFVGRTMEEIRARQNSDLPLEQLKGLHVPGQVIALLKSMLATDPNHRPQSARDLLLAVHSCYDRFNPQARWRRRKAILVNVALTLAIIAIVCGTWLYQRLRSFTPEERSIAVLPFENLSSDKENAYFAEGIQDEILTRLSKISNLKVISRTSTQHFQSAPKNLREIAKQLGVAHILEGSVQKSADTVRVNVQLADVAPTMVEYLGLAAVDWMEGLSLLQADRLPPGRSIFGVSDIKRRDGAPGLRLLRDGGPPNFGASAAMMIAGNAWFEISLLDGTLRSGDVTGHTGTRLTRVSEAAARAALQKKLASAGFAVERASFGR
jgi:serine/threonine protein kinase